MPPYHISMATLKIINHAINNSVKTYCLNGNKRKPLSSHGGTTLSTNTSAAKSMASNT